MGHNLISSIFPAVACREGTVHEKHQTLYLVLGWRFKTSGLPRSRDISVCVTDKHIEEMLNLNF